MNSSTVSFRKAGKAIGGGKLTHAVRRGVVVGTIVETLGLFIVAVSHASADAVTVHHSAEEARAKFSA